MIIIRQNTRFMFCVLMAIICILPACGWGSQDMPAHKESTMSRIGIPGVKPVEFEGKRYEQIIYGEREQLDQRTGYLAVIDSRTNQRLKAIKVYDVAFDKNMEADVQDVFLPAHGTSGR